MARANPARPSLDSTMMNPESHPWLRWPGSSAQRKIELNNNLALLQGKAISSPKFMDWPLCATLGIEEELDELFVTRGPDQFDVEVWLKAFDVREQAYRELCLEFYSSLAVDDLPESHRRYEARIIRFRLGGREHEVSIPEFGRLTGLFTREEAEDEENMSGYLLVGSWNSNDVRERRHVEWFALSGKQRHTATSKATEIQSPILRLVHKMISYSFLHRATHQDKVYVDDLWLLSYFAKQDLKEFVNAPWALANYMLEKGGGRQSNGPMVCGHFVTRIARNLGLASSANLRMCNPGVGWKLITRQDLRKADLLTSQGAFVTKEEESSQQAPPPAPSHGQESSMREEIYRIGREIDGTRRDVRGIGDYVQYHSDRYQSSWEFMAQQHYANIPGSSGGWPPYTPPQMFPPSPPREAYQEGDDDDEEED